MPVTKVPVVHRFGIISHNQRIQLQERLLKRAVEQATAQPFERSSNPFDLPESFVTQFNAAVSLTEKENYEKQAKMHLERLKRKIGLRNKCQVSSKHLDEAWVDLSILSQCKGRTQDESLDVLIMSLDLLALDIVYIRGLFYLAETAVYWLRTDSVNSPYLRSHEIKLLKMAQMVFTRLFYHHMAGDLRGNKLFKNRLYAYLDGLSDYQEAYSPYPNAHLCLRYVIEAGKVILMHEDLDPGELKEGDSVSATHFETTNGVPHSIASAVSHSVHDLTPTLWHCLDVWRCVTVTGQQIEDALFALAQCSLTTSLDSWLDSAAAFLVLGEAAKVNLSVLIVMQNLACGLVPSTVTCDHHMNQIDDIETLSSGLAIAVDQRSVDQRTKSAGQFTTPLNTPRKVTRQSQIYSVLPTADTGHRANAGTAGQQKSTPSTYGNSPMTDSPGIQSWNWELALVYIEIMSELVLYSSTSAIKKRALLGSRVKVDDIVRSSCRPPLESAGLLELLHFHLHEETFTHDADDWSWRVRFSAVQGLVRICRHLAKDKMSDGLYQIAWHSLLEAHAQERDERVLEALKVGQVGVKHEEISKDVFPCLVTSCLGSHIADGLARRYLPKITLVPERRKSPTKKEWRKVQVPSVQKLRTTLRDELKMAAATEEPPIPDFKTRTSKDLMRIVEDQWRKELHEQLREQDNALKKKTDKHEPNLSTGIEATDSHGVTSSPSDSCSIHHNVPNE